MLYEKASCARPMLRLLRVQFPLREGDLRLGGTVTINYPILDDNVKLINFLVLLCRHVNLRS